MSEDSLPSSNRRAFLSGRALRSEIERVGDAAADELAEAVAARIAPTAGETIRLTTTAMACDFSVILNPGERRQVMAASDALDVIHQLEAQLTVYRPESELSQLNRRAARRPVTVERQLFELLRTAQNICLKTGGCFDPTTGPLIRLWRCCRDEQRIPTQGEIDTCLEHTGMHHVEFTPDDAGVRFTREGVELNLGGIGKGYALDRAAALLEEAGLRNFLLHGGFSSILARGEHRGLGGWPVGIMNPLFPRHRFATVLLRDTAMSTSGSAVQYYRYGGRRFGHILDPRSGWPVENALSTTVFTPQATDADALSTAFFVMGVENARKYCDNCSQGTRALLFPAAESRRIEPVVCGLSPDVLFLNHDQPG